MGVKLILFIENEPSLANQTTRLDDMRGCLLILFIADTSSLANQITGLGQLTLATVHVLRMTRQ